MLNEPNFSENPPDSSSLLPSARRETPYPLRDYLNGFPHAFKCAIVSGIQIQRSTLGAHSTRSISTSIAFLNNVPLLEVCKVATWASVHTFAKTQCNHRALQNWRSSGCHSTYLRDSNYSEVLPPLRGALLYSYLKWSTCRDTHLKELPLLHEVSNLSFLDKGTWNRNRVLIVSSFFTLVMALSLSLK